MKFVCPLPMIWNKIHRRLTRAWESNGRRGETAPIPLILGGWWSSNDVQKHERWLDTVAWAKRNGLEHLIPELADNQKYMVSEMTSYEVGPLGGPMYLDWSFEAKVCPENNSVVDALEELKNHWNEVAGPELAAHTEPIKFTGKKCRRLLVKAMSAYRPPWGSWNQLNPGEERRTFTQLRKRVNNLIAPLMVDHIDFEVSEKDTQSAK